MTIDRIIENLKQMAWERAKGELRSILHVFWEDAGSFQEFKEKLDEFIFDIENNSTWL